MNQTVSYTNARQNFKSVLDLACKNSQPVLIRRRNGGNAILISEEDYRSLDESAYLNSSPTNKKHLQKSLQELKTKKVVKASLSKL